LTNKNKVLSIFLMDKKNRDLAKQANALENWDDDSALPKSIFESASAQAIVDQRIKINVSALSAEGLAYQLGLMDSSATIVLVKEKLSEQSEFQVESQQLYVLDDTRDGEEDLELKAKGLTLQDVVLLSNSAAAAFQALVASQEQGEVALQFAVMVSTGHDCVFGSLDASGGYGSHHSFDKNGAIYLIATAGLTQPYTNPHESGEVVAAMSSNGCDSDCCPAHFVLHKQDGKRLLLIRQALILLVLICALFRALMCSTHTRTHISKHAYSCTCLLT
jgi:hypothetical protein